MSLWAEGLDSLERLLTLRYLLARYEFNIVLCV